MDYFSDERMQQQLDLEREMVESGAARFYRQERQAEERGDASASQGARFLIRHMLSHLEAALTAFMAEADSGKAGRRHTAVKFIRKLDTKTVAFLALREAINSGMARRNVQSAARSMAQAVINEITLKALKKADPDMFRVVVDKAMEHSGTTHRNAAARGMLRNRMEQAAAVSVADEVQIGMKLLDLVIEATGLLETHHERDQNDPKKLKPVTVLISPVAAERITQARGVFSAMSPNFLPWVVPPAPWQSQHVGAQYSGVVRGVKLVKQREKGFGTTLKGADTSLVMEAINAVQETPWKINRRVLDVLEEAFDTERAIAGLVEREPEIPPFPEEAKLAATERGVKARKKKGPDATIFSDPVMEASREALKTWKKAAASTYGARRQAVSKRLSVRRSIDLARRFQDNEAIWFPHTMDFRGRMYPLSSDLSPQGADFSKALLTFAEGKPIEDGVAAGWLAVHVANCFGFDKATLEDRVAWTEHHNDTIKQIGADPWMSPGFEFWSKADKPWQFLAACIEWAGFLAHGYGFVSLLPVSMDGSCNGLQHYSAALRDPIGGAAVNLVPSGKPANIYATVAERTIEKIRAFVCPNGSANGTVPDMEKLRELWGRFNLDEIDMAQRWLAFGIDRKLTKRAVMTLPYGSTQHSCRQFIEEAAREAIEKGKPNLFREDGDRGGEGLFRASLWLQPFVWQSIGETVQAARSGMTWLQDCAKVVTDAGQAVSWTTPDGFPVVQSYRNNPQAEVKSNLAGRIYVMVDVPSDTAPHNKRQATQGVAPNWVHSMDATALRKYVLMAKDNGVRSFALVHDSYGAVAADVQTMLACLKEAFIDLYSGIDPLYQFFVNMVELLPDGAHTAIPPLPPKGSLDLSEVRASDFFFA